MTISQAIGERILSLCKTRNITVNHLCLLYTSEYPHYTKPAVWRGKPVPEVLLSGHHGNIEKWRRQQALLRTAKKRPEMLEKTVFTKEEQALLEKALRNQE